MWHAKIRSHEHGHGAAAAGGGTGKLLPRDGSGADTGEGMCGGRSEAAVVEEMLNCCFWQL